MALINAIITYKDNTLVTEFPKDYLKIYEELNSIGSRKAPERIPLTDNEDDDIRVKLYADSDIGNHLLLLLGETSTLADANTAAFAVVNADEDIRQELEQNLLYDQYSNTAELLRDIREMTEQAGPVKMSFFCPLEGNIEDAEYGDLTPVGNLFLKSLLHSQGKTLKRSGSEYEWRDGSSKVTILGNLWFHKYDREGGDAIDFVRRFFGKTYPEAMEYLLGGCGGTLIISPPVQKEPPKPFELPPKNENMRRVCAYLINHRGINKDVVYAFAHRGMIYESADYHNAVFVVYDASGVPRHAHKRGSGSKSSYKGNVDSSLPEYSFHWHGQAEPAPNPRTEHQSKLSNGYPRQSSSGKLYLFEAPIDMLSFISLHTEHWKTHSYAAACGVSDYVLWQMMKDNLKIQKVYLCLDNDEPGQTAAKRISDKLFTKGVQHEILVPIHKDWNEDLIYPTEEESEEEGETECQALQP